MTLAVAQRPDTLRFIRKIRAMLRLLLKKVADAQEVSAEFPKVLSTLDYALDVPELDSDSAELLLKTASYVEHNGFAHSWLDFFERLAPRLPKTEPHYIRLLHNKGTMLGRLGTWEDAIEIHEEALQLAEQFDPDGTVVILVDLASDYIHQNNPDRAEQFLLDAEARMHRGASATDMEFRVLNLMGLIFLRRGAYEDALGRFERSATLSLQRNDMQQYVTVRQNYCHALWGLGRLDEAIEELQILQPQSETTTSARLPAQVRLLTGAILFDQNELDASLAAFDAMDEGHLKRFGYVDLLASQQTNIGLILKRQQKLEDAREPLHAGARYWRESGNGIEIAFVTGQLGHLEFLQSNLVRARHLLTTALARLGHHKSKRADALREEFTRYLTEVASAEEAAGNQPPRG